MNENYTKPIIIMVMGFMSDEKCFSAFRVREFLTGTPILWQVIVKHYPYKKNNDA